MPKNPRSRFSHPAAATLLLLTSVFSGCATVSGPLDIEMWTSERPSAYAKPDYSGNVDFDRGLFVADIFGKHYVGKLEPVRSGQFDIHAQTNDGLTLNCFFVQLQPALWHGSCTEASGEVIEMTAGHHWHV